MLHLLYGGLARARRGWYERRPASRRHLGRPVISVGNLSVGGTGKTPLVAAIAQWLVDQGERPAILSRGYARRDRTAEPAVVSDGHHVRLDVHAAGDEPLMLARAVPAAVVVVGADRHAAGRHAEAQLGATVHILDDGFQHLQLDRDLDIVVTPAGSLADDHVLPKGRLREPLDALTHASILVVVGADDRAAAAEAARYGVALGLGAGRRLEAPVAVHGGVPPPGARVVAVAGIGQPDQFFGGLRQAGWDVVGTRVFPDHHRFAPADLAEVARLAADVAAWGVVTTDKDAVRLEPLGPLPCAVARVPLALDVPQFDRLASAMRAAVQRHRSSPAATAEAGA
jgi:tetraacyldisaccharide 4'-kinase